MCTYTSSRRLRTELADAVTFRQEKKNWITLSATCRCEQMRGESLKKSLILPFSKGQKTCSQVPYMKSADRGEAISQRMPHTIRVQRSAASWLPLKNIVMIFVIIFGRGL